jgi:hypothetical protein
MVAISYRLPRVATGAVAILAVMIAASCAPMSSPPRQVQSSNPTVTYKYRGDEELIQANQSATVFCNQYQSTPRTVTITNASDGSKTVVFECLRTATPVVAQPQFSSNLTYNYRTDQELLDASRSAENYCMNNGSQRAISNSTVVNANGTKTVTFQCSPR